MVLKSKVPEDQRLMRSQTSYRIVVPAALLFTVGAIGALQSILWCDKARAQTPSEPQATPPDGRNDDRAAVRAALDSFVKAFESRDAKALAAHWTAGGEYHSLEGAKVQGRDALEKGFTAYFARNPELKAKIDHESVRFLSSDSAIEEGSVAVQRGPLEPTINARYSALVVREGGRWLVAQLIESLGDKESIGDLGWLVGDWKSMSKQGAEIQTTYTWHPNKKFLQAQFTIKETSRTFSGTQIIGVDPATGSIHSWTFEADGGVGEADWNRDGDHWLVGASGTLTDGRTMTETNILRRMNDDTFTCQSVDRHLEDETLADLAPVKVTRLKP
jgi:uncharacterized protein (TIGR02246 family)